VVYDDDSKVKKFVADLVEDNLRKKKERLQLQLQQQTAAAAATTPTPSHQQDLSSSVASTSSLLSLQDLQVFL